MDSIKPGLVHSSTCLGCICDWDESTVALQRSFLLMTR